MVHPVNGWARVALKDAKPQGRMDTRLFHWLLFRTWVETVHYRGFQVTRSVYHLAARPPPMALVWSTFCEDTADTPAL